MNFKARNFALTLGLAQFCGAIAFAQNYSELPIVKAFTTHQGRSLYVEDVKIEGTLFSKQIWVRVDGNAVTIGMNTKCANQECWVYLGNYRPN